MIPTIETVASNATIVHLSKITLYFSYQTCVAFKTNTVGFQRAKSFSSTTSRHLTKFGIKNLPKLEETAFIQTLEDQMKAVNMEVS